MRTFEPTSPIRLRIPTINLAALLPCLTWLRRYQRQELVSDSLAGMIVAIMLVPQSMAYAMLAGLPPQMGLYASVVPLVLYGLFGTSRFLAVGPVAMVSLLVMSGLSELAQPGSAAYVTLALQLALLVGLIHIAMSMLRLGCLVNFLSHPVLSGFTSAAALMIAGSQFEHLLGIKVPLAHTFIDLVQHIGAQITATNLVTLSLGLGSFLFLLYIRLGLGRQLRRWGIAESWIAPITRSGPLVVVVLSTLIVRTWALHDGAGVSIVGSIPAGLPSLTMPTFDRSAWQTLLPTALVISLVGFMESISVAKSLARKHREKVNADQELLALGLANIAAACTGGYAIAGSFSRSSENFQADAKTGLASIITAGLVALILVLFTPLFFYLPKAVLAAIIVVAVSGLVDVPAFLHAWRYNRSDAVSLLITFSAVLVIGIEMGLLVGVASAIVFYLWRTSTPHVTIVGRVGNSEYFRNVQRHAATTTPHVLAVRVDESLYFANTHHLEDVLHRTVAEQQNVQHVVLICSAMNHIDTSALETLEHLTTDLHEAGINLVFAEVKSAVMDGLRKIGFVSRLGENHFFMSTHQAMQTLSGNEQRRPAPMRRPVSAPTQETFSPSVSVTSPDTLSTWDNADALAVYDTDHDHALAGV